MNASEDTTISHINLHIVFADILDIQGKRFTLVKFLKSPGQIRIGLNKFSIVIGAKEVHIVTIIKLNLKACHVTNRSKFSSNLLTS